MATKLTPAQKAANTRRRNTEAARRREIALKAVATRQANARKRSLAAKKAARTRAANRTR